MALIVLLSLILEIKISKKPKYVHHLCTFKGVCLETLSGYFR